MKDKESIKCLIVLFLKLNSKQFFQIFNFCHSICKIASICLLPDQFFFLVVFILNVSDNFFYDIFHCHKSCSLTILINDNRHMIFPFLHLFQQFINTSRLRYKAYWSYVFLQLFNRNMTKLFVKVAFHCIPQMNRSDDRINIFFIDRKSGFILL